MMDQLELKTWVGRAAVDWVTPDEWLGVGSGSTVQCFIDALVQAQLSVRGAVSSSVQTTKYLQARGIRVIDANEVASLPVYIDGADEIDPSGCMIKGGGAALTGEKIVADLAQRIVCIADASKAVPVLGAFPLPVEVMPMAHRQIARRFKAMGADPHLREGVVTDHGNLIVDVHGLRITDPLRTETEISAWPGVITVGIFARHRASVCLLGTTTGVQTIHYPPAVHS